MIRTEQQQERALQQMLDFFEDLMARGLQQATKELFKELEIFELYSKQSFKSLPVAYYSSITSGVKL